MSRTARVSAREPVSDFAREASRLEPQPKAPSVSAGFLYWAIVQALIRRLKGKVRGRRIAPDSTVVLHDCRRPVPETVRPAGRVIARSSAAYERPRRCVGHVRRRLASVCRGSIPESSRNPLSRTSLPRPMPDSFRIRVARASYTSRVRVGAYGSVRIAPAPTDPRVARRHALATQKMGNGFP